VSAVQPAGARTELTREMVQRALDAKTKPPGSLGRLESLAVQLALLQRTTAPAVDRARVVVFGADHGVAAEGVSAYPAAVTAEMMRNFARGGAAVTVLARANGADVEVVDVGVDADLAGLDGIVHAKVRRGTRNLAVEPAMTHAELEAALLVGRGAARRAAQDGVRALGLGEMGIGNTTTAAALLSAITGESPATTVGRGTGVADGTLEHKRAVVDRALRCHAAALHDPFARFAALGGLELAAIAGAALEAARLRIAVIVDGFISTVAVLAAMHLDPYAPLREAIVCAHRSAERGHGLALRALGAEPLLDLDMRLGEGSGAACAIPLVRSAARILTDMATFESAGVSGRVD
jgi:nicotinate-nucleotide--dimethylbenzimidazole phosphoribosyltransferase